jgi:hypothetical protein
MMYRSILRRAIETALRGDDPKGILRDPSEASFVTTSAGSVVRD